MATSKEARGIEQSITSKVEFLQSAIAECTAQVEQLEATMSDSRARLAAMRGEEQAEKTKMDACSSRIRALQEEKTVLEQTVKRGERFVAEQEPALERLHTERDGKAKELEKVQQEEKAAKDKEQEKQAKVEANIKKLQSDITKQEEQISRLEAERSRLSEKPQFFSEDAPIREEKFYVDEIAIAKTSAISSKQKEIAAFLQKFPVGADIYDLDALNRLNIEFSQLIASMYPGYPMAAFSSQEAAEVEIWRAAQTSIQDYMAFLNSNTKKVQPLLERWRRVTEIEGFERDCEEKIKACEKEIEEEKAKIRKNMPAMSEETKLVPVAPENLAALERLESQRRALNAQLDSLQSTHKNLDKSGQGVSKAELAKKIDQKTGMQIISEVADISRNLRRVCLHQFYDMPLRKLDGELSAAKKEREELSSKLSQKRIKQEKFSGDSQRLQRLKDEMKEYEEKISKASARLSEEEQKVESAAKRLLAVSTEIASKTSELGAAEESLAGLEKTLAVESQRHDTAYKQWQKAGEDKKALTQQKEALESMQGAMSKLRTDLSRWSNSTFDKYVASLAADTGSSPFPASYSWGITEQHTQAQGSCSGSTAMVLGCLESRDELSDVKSFVSGIMLSLDESIQAIDKFAGEARDQAEADSQRIADYALKQKSRFTALLTDLGEFHGLLRRHDMDSNPARKQEVENLAKKLLFELHSFCREDDHSLFWKIAGLAIDPYLDESLQVQQERRIQKAADIYIDYIPTLPEEEREVEEKALRSDLQSGIDTSGLITKSEIWIVRMIKSAATKVLSWFTGSNAMEGQSLNEVGEKLLAAHKSPGEGPSDAVVPGSAVTA